MGLFDIMGDSAGSFFKKKIVQGGNELIYRARLEMWRFQKRLIKGLVSISFLLIASAFLAISAIFFMIDYLNVGRTLAFLAVGIILLIIGIILKI